MQAVGIRVSKAICDDNTPDHRCRDVHRSSLGWKVCAAFSKEPPQSPRLRRLRVIPGR